MAWFQEILVWNWSFEDYPYKKNYPLNFIDSCVKSFLNKLYTPRVVVPNVPKRNVFVKLLLLESTSFQIWKKLQNRLVIYWRLAISKLLLRHPLKLKPFSSWRMNYLRGYFQDLFTSISVVAAMLHIMEIPNAILRYIFVNIQAFHISLKKV